MKNKSIALPVSHENLYSHLSQVKSSKQNILVISYSAHSTLTSIKIINLSPNFCFTYIV